VIEHALLQDKRERALQVPVGQHVPHSVQDVQADLPASGNLPRVYVKEKLSTGIPEAVHNFICVQAVVLHLRTDTEELVLDREQVEEAVGREQGLLRPAWSAPFLLRRPHHGRTLVDQEIVNEGEDLDGLRAGQKGKQGEIVPESIAIPDFALSEGGCLSWGHRRLASC